MAWTYNELGVSLGPAYTGLAGTVGYRVLDQTKAPGAGDSIVLPFRTAGILEGAVPGDYVVPAPPAFPDVPVRIEWSADGGATYLYSKTLDPTLLELLSAQLATLPGDVLAGIGTAIPDDRCRVFGYEEAGDGRRVAGRLITAMLTATPQTTSNAIIEGGVSAKETTYSGSDGYWFLDLPKGKTYLFRIPQAGVSQSIQVPDATTANLRDLLS